LGNTPVFMHSLYKSTNTGVIISAIITKNFKGIPSGPDSFRD